MAKTPPSPFPFPPQRLYWGADIPMRVIRRYARAIAEEFHPDKIILFGSYAYGTPTATWTSSSSCQCGTLTAKRFASAGGWHRRFHSI